MAIVQDRTKTVVRRHVAPGETVALHPAAVAFAGHYDFDIDVLAAYRPQGKGCVEWQVGIVGSYVLSQRHLRRVGMDCLVAFDANLYTVPARKVRPRQLVEIRATKSQVTLHATVPGPDGEPLPAAHPRAVDRGAHIVDDMNWDGLPTCARRVTTGDSPPSPRREPSPGRRPARCRPCGWRLGRLRRGRRQPAAP